MSAPSLREAMQNAGIEPPVEVVADGLLHRFATNGKPRDLSGWYVLHDDGIPAGAFGCWRSGRSEIWRADIGRKLTPEEEAKHRARIEEAKRKAEAEREAGYGEAAERARSEWAQAKPAPDEHPYLARKGIRPHGVRADGKGNLLVPVVNAESGEPQSLQRIAADGSKRFLGGGRVAGGAFWLGKPDGGVIAVAEGFATGASVHEATGWFVAVAFNASNLLAVARAVRAKFPDARIVITGDDDRGTSGNPGRTKALEAARAVGGLAAFPRFAAEPGSDWNDLHLAEGLDAVRAQVVAALGEPEPDGGAWLHLADWFTAARFTGEPPPRAWLVPGVFLLGKPGLLAAAGGVGKSFLLLELARAVAAGGSTFGGIRLHAQAALGPVEAEGTAVLLCAEDDATEIHSRLNALGGPSERLIVTPLPDAGGVRALFTLDDKGRSPATTMHFYALAEQLRTLPDVRLICFDPLQALCGGLDLNLPQHAQHVCGELAKLAAETGAAVIVSHHFRKGGEIESPEQARDAVRGSGGLVDGARSVVAVWPDGEQTAKATCRTLGQTWERGRVCRAGVVKANFRADLRVQTLVRDENGLLVNRTFELGQMRPDAEEVRGALVAAIAQAATEGEPFTKTGQASIYAQRHRLPRGFHEIGRDRLIALVDDLLSAGRLEQFKRKQGDKAPCWLDVPGGALSRMATTETETEGASHA